MRYVNLCRLLCFLVLSAVLALDPNPAPAADATPAGSVKNLTGDVKVARDGAAPAVLNVGDRIYEKDVLTTGAVSNLGLVLRDNSTLSLGPNSKLVVEKYLFAPDKNALASLMRLKKGSMSCVTGEMAKLSPSAMQFLAAGYTLGIRGTHILVNVDEGADPEEGR